MMVFPIHHRQWGFEVGASLAEQQPQAVDRFPLQDQVSILGGKD